MQKLVITFGLTLLECTFAVAALAQAADDAPLVQSEQEHFREICKRAQSAFESRNYAQARALFLQAWSLQATPEVALPLGQSEFELKRFRDAADHLDFALSNLESSTNEQSLQPARKALTESKAQIAVLHVTTNHADAEIRIDGAAPGRRVSSNPFYLDPGRHEVTASWSNNAVTKSISLEAGQEASLSLPIIAKSSKAESPWATGAPRRIAPSTTARTSLPSPSRSIAPVIVGGAVALAGIATGIVFRLDSDTQFNNADMLRARLAREGCTGSPSNVADCSALLTAAENGDRSRNWSTVGFAVAASAAIGTAVYWYWPRSNTKEALQHPNRVRLGAAILRHASGIVISGDY